MAEVEEADSLKTFRTSEGARQDALQLDSPNRLVQGQDQDQFVPRRDREEDRRRRSNLREAPIPARQLGSRERGGREQPRPGYLHKFPMLTRGRLKLEAERSGLDDMVADIVQEGCKKRKAEMIEKDLNKMEERLENYAEMYDGAMG